MAFVTLHPGKGVKWENKYNGFEIDLKAHARKRLPGFATPEWVVIVPELPVSGNSVKDVLGSLISCEKTSTGKVQKVELRKRVAKL